MKYGASTCRATRVHSVLILAAECPKTDSTDLFNHPSGEVALATSILRDAVAFVPELAPLTEAVLAAAK
jgi:hypothetical protein